MPYVTSTDFRIHYRWDGAEAAPTLLLSNSLGTHLGMWDAQIPALTRHFRVLRYDSRGHGASSVPPGPYDMEQLARDVLALLDALRLGKVIFCGLSIGGMVGQWLGTNAAARIDKLVLASTSSFLGGRDAWNARMEAVRRGGMAAVTEAIIERWFTPRFREVEPQAVQGVRAMLLASPPEGYIASCAAVRDMDQRALLARIQSPTLVLCGTHDPATPPEHSRLIAERVPGAALVQLDGAHLCNIEAAPAFDKALLAFLS